MPTRIEETVLQGIFNAHQQDMVTTQAKFWNFTGNTVPTYPTIFVPGNTELTINGLTTSFTDGAFVYQKDGQLAAVKASVAEGGGITVGGGPVRSVSTDPYTNRPVGNTATLQFNEGTAPGTSTLTLRMPENQGAGFSFRYPAANAEDLLQLAEQKNAIVQLQRDGKVIEGFFAKNSGGVLPKSFGPYASGTSFDKGDFISVTRRPDGSAGLFAYKNYTPKEMEQATRFGTMSEPGNNLARLQTLDGKPVNPNKFTQLDTRPALSDAPGKVDGQGKLVDAPNKAPDAPQPNIDGTPPNKPALETPGGKPPVDAPATGSGATALGRLARVAAPVALAALPTIEGLYDGYQNYKNGGSALDVAEGTVGGIGKGVADTFLPGARNGYADVVGGDKTFVDRFLNAASDATGTATAIGSAAVVAETAGVISIPAAIPTGFATIVAGLSNLGINATKGALKVTGLAGTDQDGGYIYDGAKAAVNEVNYLMGWDKSAPAASASRAGSDGTDSTNTAAIKAAQADFDPDHLLLQSLESGNRTPILTSDHVESRHVG
jgi:hypothetical protein